LDCAQTGIRIEELLATVWSHASIELEALGWDNLTDAGMVLMAARVRNASG
jgi:hypothetical protein